MAGLKQVITGWSLILLFGICLIFFMLQMITVNNPDSTTNLQTNAYVNASLTRFTSSTDSLQTVGQQAQDLIASSEPSPVFTFLILKSAFQIPLAFFSFLLNAVISISLLPWIVIFGQGANDYFIILTVVNALIIIGIVLAILKAIRSGETDR